MTFTINNSKFLYGDFINAIISFIIVAAVIYFLVVVPVNRLMALGQKPAVPPPQTTRKCPECLSDIPLAATRCAFCTAAVTPA